MSRPAYLLVAIALAGLLAALNLGNAQERASNAPAQIPQKNASTPGDLAEGEKSQEFEYVIEGERKKGTCPVLTVDIGGGEKLEFVRIRKGTFTMGSPKDEPQREVDENQHEVEITKDFYLGKFTVTQAQYKAVTGENQSNFKGERLPMDNMRWDDAVKYCEELSKKLNRKVTLPSEAQWEYACRAGTKTPFHFGRKLNGDLANCDGDYPYGTEVKGTFKDKPTEVGSYPANPWGLYDMHGNVWQWCQDYFGRYEKLDGSRDPIKLVRQKYYARVIRGGSWFDEAVACRSAYRWMSAIDGHGYYIGFRVCIPLGE